MSMNEEQIPYMVIIPMDGNGDEIHVDEPLFICETEQQYEAIKNMLANTSLN